jgi:hypothetical protein
VIFASRFLKSLEKKWDELDVAMAGGIQGEAIPTLMIVRDEQQHSDEALAVLERSGSLRAEIHADSPDTSNKVNLMPAEAAQKLIDELGVPEKKNADLTALERAVADGYSDPFRVKAEPDLKPLHETERFKNVILQQEAIQAGR